MKNANTLASELMNYGYHIISGGTDNHLMLVDLTKKNISGKKAERILGWKPEISFEDGMKSTHEWAKEQGLIKK